MKKKIIISALSLVVFTVAISILCVHMSKISEAAMPEEVLPLEGSIRDDATEFWEYDEFASWMEEEKERYDKLVEEKAIFHDNQTGEDRVWTQEDVDEMYNAWIMQLELMKKGYKYMKPLETDTGGLLTGAMQPDYDQSASSLPSAYITLNDGATIELGEYATVEDAIAAAKEYLSKEVEKGSITQQEADEIYDRIVNVD